MRYPNQLGISAFACFVISGEFSKGSVEGEMRLRMRPIYFCVNRILNTWFVRFHCSVAGKISIKMSDGKLGIAILGAGESGLTAS